MVNIACAACGVVVIRRSPTQKYCTPCSADRQRERGRKWAGQNPLSEEKKARRLANNKAREQARREEGGRRKQPAAITHVARTPVLKWMVRVSMPFSYAASKNAVYSNRGGKGHVFMRKEAKAVKEEITIRLREALAGREIKHNKLYLSIFVEKPDHKGDAVNVLDLVSDAVEDATGLNDRWYSVQCIDWSVRKAGGRLVVSIGQPECEDAQVCSYCGEILPVDHFTKKKGTKLGVDRVCRMCRKTDRVAGISR